MQELKFSSRLGNQMPAQTCCSVTLKNTPAWVSGNVVTPAGAVLRVSTVLSMTDYWEHFRCRTTSYRNNYKVNPGLYAVGDPDKDSDVLVSANYKYSFDLLRSALKGLDAWILVLDTQGINVWCAAGKGTFGTAELVKRISAAQLDKVVDHRRIIVPQLGAPGVSAFKVKQTAGFKVLYGPVRAKDIPAYIKAGYKATRDMRRVNFTVFDRLILTPMEINPAMKKFPLYAALVLVVFGLSPSGIMFMDAFTGGLPFLFFGLLSVFSGALLTPVLLPYVPFRSFAVKGWIIGLLSVFLSATFVPSLIQQNTFLLIVTYLFFPAASSFIALQFTGSTTFTGMSGVKRELRVAIPTYIVSCGVSLVLLIMYKLTMWGVI